MMMRTVRAWGDGAVGDSDREMRTLATRDRLDRNVHAGAEPNGGVHQAHVHDLPRKWQGVRCPLAAGRDGRASWVGGCAMRMMAAASVREHVRALNAMKVSMFATMFAQSSRVHIARLMPGWITPASMRKLRGGGEGTRAAGGVHE